MKIFDEIIEITQDAKEDVEGSTFHADRTIMIWLGLIEEKLENFKRGREDE